MPGPIALLSLADAMTIVEPPVKCETPTSGPDVINLYLTVDPAGPISLVGQNASGGLRETSVLDISQNLQNHGWFHPKLTPKSLAKPLPFMDTPASVRCTDNSVSLRVVFGPGQELSAGWVFKGDRYVGKPFTSLVRQAGWARCEDFNIPAYAFSPCCPSSPSQPCPPSRPISPPSLTIKDPPNMQVTYQGTPGLLQASVTAIEWKAHEPTRWSIAVDFIPSGSVTKPVSLAETEGGASPTSILSTKDPENPKVMHGSFPLTYYASWNGADSFILAHRWSSNQTSATSANPSTIKALLDNVEEARAIPAHYVTTSSSNTNKSKSSWSDPKLIGFMVTAGVLLMLSILLVVLLVKAKEKTQ